MIHGVCLGPRRPVPDRPAARHAAREPANCGDAAGPFSDAVHGAGSGEEPRAGRPSLSRSARPGSTNTSRTKSIFDRGTSSNGRATAGPAPNRPCRKWAAHAGSRAGQTKPPLPDRTPPEPLEAVLDRKVAAKLEEQKQQRQLDPETLPPDADNLAGLVYTLLRQCLNGPRSYALTDVQRPAPPNKKQRPTYHLTVKQRRDGQEICIGVLFLTTSDASSAVWALRRILEDRKPPARLLLVADQRRPLRLATKGKEYLDQLHRNYGDRFQQHRPDLRPVRRPRRPQGRGGNGPVGRPGN